jgi:hypothetical protein
VWGDAHPGCLDGRPGAWDRWPLPAGACKGGMDGGDVRQGGAQTPPVEGMVGKRTRRLREAHAATGPASTRLGCGHTREPKPTRRWDEGVPAPGGQQPQDGPLLSDGHDPLRALQCERSPPATQRGAWALLTLKLPVLAHYAQGVGPGQAALGEALREQIERLT